MKTIAKAGEGDGAQGGEDVRCTCGNLVARWVGQRIELKCRRCKRRVYLDSPPRAKGEARDPP